MMTHVTKTISTLALVVVLVGWSITAVAQGPGPGGSKYEEIQTLKVAFLSKQLNLTVDEAQVFWPVYNEFEDKMHSLKEEQREATKDLHKNFATLSDKELEKLVDTHFEYRQKELDLQKQYNEAFKKVLPIRKVAMLHKAQQEFKKFLLKKLSGHKGPKGGSGPGIR